MTQETPAFSNGEYRICLAISWYPFDLVSVFYYKGVEESQEHTLSFRFQKETQ